MEEIFLNRSNYKKIIWWSNGAKNRQNINQIHCTSVNTAKLLLTYDEINRRHSYTQHILNT